MSPISRREFVGAGIGAAARRLIAVQGAGSGLLDFDLLPVGLEFLSENHG